MYIGVLMILGLLIMGGLFWILTQIATRHRRLVAELTHLEQLAAEVSFTAEAVLDQVDERINRLEALARQFEQRGVQLSAPAGAATPATAPPEVAVKTSTLKSAQGKATTAKVDPGKAGPGKAATAKVDPAKAAGAAAIARVASIQVAPAQVAPIQVASIQVAPAQEPAQSEPAVDAALAGTRKAKGSGRGRRPKAATTAESDPAAADPAPAAVATGSGAAPNRYHALAARARELLAQGKDHAEIAQALDLPRGEVQLLLNLRVG